MAKIFLIEDDPLMVRMYEKAFKLSGYEVETAFDGEEALAKIGKMDPKPTLMVLDIMMPNLDGINTVKILKKIDSRMPIVTFSGVAGSGDIAASIRVGAMRCLTKPFSVEQLLSEIKKVLHT